MVDASGSAGRTGPGAGRHARRQRAAAGTDVAAPATRGRAADRERGAAAVLALTVLGTLLPGLGLLVAGRRRAGLAITGLTVAATVAAAVWIGRNPLAAASVAVSAGALRTITAVAVALAVAWAALAVVTHRALRPAGAPDWLRAAGAALVGVLCLLVATPTALVAGYARTTEQTIEQIFGPVRSATAPTAVPSPAARDPWAGIDRVNVLLLGGDAGEGRDGIRTDSMAVASIDTRTGRTVLISLPRSLQRLSFQPGTPLAAAYPNGYVTVPGDTSSGENLLNSVYRNVPAYHPGILGGTDNAGADALKLGIGWSIGLDIDYYVLIEPAGFQQAVTALGGYTVDINEPVAVGGNTDKGILPNRWLLPGPDQRLDGYLGTWFARGRYGDERGDYGRVRRQRCAVQALTAQASPARVLLSYQQLARTAADVTRTDIPRGTFGPLVVLGGRVKQTNRISSVVVDTTGIPAMRSTVRPNWTAVRAAVAAAIRRSTATAAPPGTPAATRPPTSPTAPTTPPTTPPATRAPTTRAPTTPAASPDDDLAVGCAYDPVAAGRALARWQEQYGTRYDANGVKR